MVIALLLADVGGNRDVWFLSAGVVCPDRYSGKGGQIWER